MALGATPRATLILSVRRVLGTVLAGVLLGMCIVPIANRLLQGYLYAVPAEDVTTHVVASLTALLVCAVAAYAATQPLRGADLTQELRMS